MVGVLPFDIVADMRILLIQSRRRPEMLASEQGEYERAAEGTGTVFSFVSSLDLSLPWATPARLLKDMDALIIGGSGEFDFDGGRESGDEARVTSRTILERLRPLIAYVTEHDTPTLGVCYGHQIIAEAHGVSVIHDRVQNKVGTAPVRLTKAGKNDPLFVGLPDTFLTQYGHKDSLSALPAGATLLAEGDRCRFSALRYRTRLYTVQFHPELTASDVVHKLANSPGYLPDGVEPSSIVHESSDASTIIPRFVRLFA